MNTRLNLIVITLLFNFGCASLGPKFTRPEMPAEGKAKLYFYRESNFRGGGVSCKVNDLEEKSKVVNVSNGGFYHLDIPAQSKVFFVEQLFGKLPGEDRVNISLEEGQTAFVKCIIKLSPNGGIPVLSVIESDVALEEIKECHQIMLK